MPDILARASESLVASYVTWRDGRTPYEDVYRPLNTDRHEIRLLVVEPGIEGEIVKCSFQYAFLKRRHKPQFETISYVWGDARTRATVQLGSKVMDVPASSDRVLRRLRYPYETRTLWIDALCINQDDDVEKSSQVALMYEIYSNTKRNLILLGDGHDTTPIAIDCIRRIVKDMKAETNNLANARTLMYNADVPQISGGPLPFNLTSREIDAINRFYASEWFQRLWVVQEASLAPSNVCHQGDHECSLDDVLRAARWLSYKRQSIAPSLFFSPDGAPLELILKAGRLSETCDRSIGNHHQTRRTRNLFGLLLQVGRDLNTTDPKDHVFAILGLASGFLGWDRIPALLKPDYSKSTAAVLRDATIYAIWDRKDLAILNCVQHRTEASPVPGLPTWVPVWSRSHDTNVDPLYLDDTWFRSCGKESLSLTQCNSGNQLSVVGLIIQEVQTVSSLLTLDLLREKTRMDSYKALAQVFQGQGHTDHSWPDRLDLAMTFTGGYDQRMRPWTGKECEKAFNFYNEAAISTQIRNIGDLTSESTEKDRLAANFCQSMYNALLHRRLFITKSGALGLGPQTARPGDSIAILYGCTIPVALRQVDSVESKYEFVGQCYMYGFMDGEAVQAHRDTSEKDTAFILI